MHTVGDGFADLLVEGDAHDEAVAPEVGDEAVVAAAALTQTPAVLVEGDAGDEEEVDVLCTDEPLARDDIEGLDERGVLHEQGGLAALHGGEGDDAVCVHDRVGDDGGGVEQAQRPDEVVKGCLGATGLVDAHNAGVADGRELVETLGEVVLIPLSLKGTYRVAHAAHAASQGVLVFNETHTDPNTRACRRCVLPHCGTILRRQRLPVQAPPEGGARKPWLSLKRTKSTTKCKISTNRGHLAPTRPLANARKSSTNGNSMYK